MNGSRLDKSIINRWTTAILTIIFLLSLFLIVFATLSPFKFAFPSLINRFDLIPKVSASSAGDFFRNTVLFIPFSFALSLVLQNIVHKTQKPRFSRILLCCFLVSLSVEILQLYLPQRTPTSIDIISNSFGGYLGFFLFIKSGTRFFVFIRYFSKVMITFISKKRNIVILFFSYCFLVFALISHLDFLVGLSNWDASFPLVIGNELTGDRPWQGYIQELYIFNKELSAQEIDTFIQPDKTSLTIPSSLLVAIDFRDFPDYQYSIPNLPSLTWFDQNQTNRFEDSKGISLDDQHWLKSEAAVAPLINKISKSSQLSIITNISTKSLDQEGPARIVSISQSPYFRNLTLGQAGNSLMVRTRTPFTRENADRPSIVFPNVFTDHNSHYLAYTYNSKQAKLFLDDIHSVDTVVFSIAAKFFWSLNDLPHFPVFTPDFIFPESGFLNFLNIIFYLGFALPIIILGFCFLNAT